MTARINWQPLPSRIRDDAAQHLDSVLLETSRFDAHNRHSYLFARPEQLLIANRLDELPRVFSEVQAALKAGLYVAGFLSYECAEHFEPTKTPRTSPSPTPRPPHSPTPAPAAPLAWLGVYRRPVVFDHADAGLQRGHTPRPHPPPHSPVQLPSQLSLDMPAQEYVERIREIKAHLTAGDTYQVNFTDQVSFATNASPLALYNALCARQPVSYGALINATGFSILSFSPELFFRIDGRTIVMRPMKGTTARAFNTNDEDDTERANWLRNDPKNGSEHVMIVDLLRSDMGRVCQPGTVKVEEFLNVEHYPTVHQMTSTISGLLATGIDYYDIFRSLFPSGSITGAPKVRTREIIHDLERRPRGIYTGAIGYITPEGRAVFNVAIRTLTLSHGRAVMGVGGGIVADSDAQDEYRECLLKASFLTQPESLLTQPESLLTQPESLLTQPEPSFQLIETIHWHHEFTRLDMHLDRLQRSAEHFHFAFDRPAVTTQLLDAAQLIPDQPHRIRLLLHANGEAKIETAEFQSINSIARITLATEHTRSSDPLLKHKTTRREMYDRAYFKACAQGFDEVIFTNEHGEVTEGAISNIIIEKAGQWRTPPLHCGVLPGVYRRHLLQTRPDFQEQVLSVDDLRAADRIFICNSLRGLREATLHE
jgi:para-aminobenzoate synthetase/4-amino-4-deoxychorismate lyase